MTIEAGKKVYIGDGVYAYHDGYQIWLETELFEGPQSIALEIGTFQALFQFGATVGGPFDLTAKEK